MYQAFNGFKYKIILGSELATTLIINQIKLTSNKKTKILRDIQKNHLQVFVHTNMNMPILNESMLLYFKTIATPDQTMTT